MYGRTAQVVEVLGRGVSGEIMSFFEESFPWEGWEREAAGWLSWWYIVLEGQPFYESQLTPAVRKQFPGLEYMARAESSWFWDGIGLGHKWSDEELDEGLDRLKEMGSVWQAEAYYVQSILLESDYQAQAVEQLRAEIGDGVAQAVLIRMQARGWERYELLDFVKSQVEGIDHAAVGVTLLGLLHNEVLSILEEDGDEASERFLDHCEPVVRQVVDQLSESDLVAARGFGFLLDETADWSLNQLQRFYENGSSCKLLIKDYAWILGQKRGWIQGMKVLPRKWSVGWRYVRVLKMIMDVAERMEKRARSAP